MKTILVIKNNNLFHISQVLLSFAALSLVLSLIPVLDDSMGMILNPTQNIGFGVGILFLILSIKKRKGERTKNKY